MQLSLRTTEVKFGADSLVPKEDPVNVSYFCHSAPSIYWNPYWAPGPVLGPWFGGFSGKIDRLGSCPARILDLI